MVCELFSLSGLWQLAQVPVAQSVMSAPDQMVIPQSHPVAPALIAMLCVIAGIGTYLLLPGRREMSIRAIGGVIVLAATVIFSAMLIRWTAGESRGGMGPFFWIFSAIALFGALRVITHTKPVYSALYFVLTVFATAGLFLLLWAEFMAAALVLIYAGAILVTYVFVIMLAAEAASPAGAETRLDSTTGKDEYDTISREPLAACVVGFALLGMLLFVIFDKFQTSPSIEAKNNVTFVEQSTEALGTHLFREEVVSLELAGLLLTVAMVGAIMIARKRVIVPEDRLMEMKPEVVTGPATPIDDDPHSIPVQGTRNPRQKAYPQT